MSLMTTETQTKRVRRTVSGRVLCSPYLQPIWVASRHVKWIVVVLNATALVQQRNAFCIILSLGAVANALLSMVFKYALQQVTSWVQ